MRVEGARSSIGRVLQLDGWRGISISFVVLGHLFGQRYSYPIETDLMRVSGVLAEWGVELFFVISGFIITKLALAEVASTGQFSVREFYIRRLFRIVPPFYFYLLVIALLSKMSWIDSSPVAVFEAGSFLCNFPGNHCGWFAGHSWSLAYEEQFYVVFPMLFVLFARRAKAVFLIIISILFLFPTVRWGLTLQGFWQVAAGFMPRFTYICVGVLAAIFERNCERLSIGRFGILFVLTALAVLAALLFLDGFFEFPFGSRGAYVQAGFTRLFLPVCFGWLVVSSLYTPVLSKLLCLQPLVSWAQSRTAYIYGRNSLRVSRHIILPTACFSPRR